MMNVYPSGLCLGPLAVGFYELAATIAPMVGRFVYLNAPRIGAFIEGLSPAAAGSVGAAGVGRVAKSGAKAAESLSAQQSKSISSYEKRILEHQEKLEQFKANPTIRPGMENLPKEAIEKQWQRRINHL